MKKLFLACLMLFTFMSTAHSYVVVMDDWGMKPNGTLIEDINGFGFDGVTLVNGDVPDASGNGTFRTFGTMTADTFQTPGAVIYSDVTGLGVDYEITAVLATAGTFHRPASGDTELTYNAGTLEFWVDTSKDYGTAGNIFGAAGAPGTSIGTFELVTGSGTMDNITGELRDGRMDLLFKSTALTADIWFDPAGNDMSTSGLDPLLLGLLDSNSHEMNTINTTALSEFLAASTLTHAGTNTSERFFVSHDGSFGVAVIPEPTTMLLFGMGLLGVAGISRRKIE